MTRVFPGRVEWFDHGWDWDLLSPAFAALAAGHSDESSVLLVHTRSSGDEAGPRLRGRTPSWDWLRYAAKVLLLHQSSRSRMPAPLYSL